MHYVDYKFYLEFGHMLPECSSERTFHKQDDFWLFNQMFDDLSSAIQ